MIDRNDLLALAGHHRELSEGLTDSPNDVVKQVARCHREFADELEALAAKAEPPSLDEMVSRFLGWRLPDDFAPDGGISFTPHPYPECWPIGTNLLTEPQARSMFLQCLPAVAFECSDWKDRALAAEATIERALAQPVTIVVSGGGGGNMVCAGGYGGRMLQPGDYAVFPPEETRAQPVVDEAMVERVAEAMLVAAWKNDPTVNWQTVGECTKERYRRMARAALTAAQQKEG